MAFSKLWWQQFSRIHIQRQWMRPLLCLAIGILAIILVSSIGYLEVHAAHKAGKSSLEEGDVEFNEAFGEEIDAYVDVVDSIRPMLDMFNWERIKRHLEHLTNETHVAGTEANERAAQYIYDTWLQQGVDQVEFKQYRQVLMSYPNANRPNKVRLYFSDTNKTLFESAGISKAILPSEQGDDHQWNAYSATGSASGDIVYCNYGSKTDFEWLKAQNIDLRGKIALIRYGYGWRGNKAALAQKQGAVAVLLYSDPAEYAQQGQDNVYPNSIWMPKQAVQRGTLLMVQGDPLTPQLPAKNYTYRTQNQESLKQRKKIPSIPVQPISYSDALAIFKALSGPEVPESWRGKLEVTYQAGGSFKQKGVTANIQVHTNNQRRDIRNVVAYINGYAQPDRYVILGNHYDAWTPGAVDPNSGTAAMLEITQVLTTLLHKNGWRPKRTLVFCAWDAEEYGLLGSTEWVEEHLRVLQARAVAYLNVDLVSGNETLSVAAMPTLYKVATAAAKMVSNPSAAEHAASRTTIFDTWIHKLQGYISPQMAKMPLPNAGSDHAAFAMYAGIPVADITYKNLSITSYPLYHTNYDTRFLMEHLMDVNQLAFVKAVSQYWAVMARMLAESHIIPLNVFDYGKFLMHNVNRTKQAISGAQITEPMEELSELENSADRFLNAAKRFEKMRQNLLQQQSASQLNIERLNERLVSLERNFLTPLKNLPNQDMFFQHAIFGLDPENQYGGVVFPGIRAAIYAYQQAKSDGDKNAAIASLRTEINVVQYALESTILSLKLLP